MRSFLLGGLLIALARPLAAQTGTITGTVRDSAGAPIANAQVFIVGTAFSALTDAQGTYTIRNVPPGEVDLRAAFVGYRPALVRKLSVTPDQMTTYSITLATSITTSGCTLGVYAERPLVPRDHNTSRFYITREMLGHDPIHP